MSRGMNTVGVKWLGSSMWRIGVLLLTAIAMAGLAACSPAANGGAVTDDRDVSADVVFSEAAPNPADAAHEAYYAKLVDLLDKWGYPAEMKAAGAYISGVAYAKLVDFGDGMDRLLVSYYDPAGDRNPNEPGGALESYPVEVWEYDSSAEDGVRQVYAGHSQLEGQDAYCSCILLGKSAGCYAVYEREVIPLSRSYVAAYGLDGQGMFGLIHEHEVVVNHDPATKETSTTYYIDGEEVDEETFAAASPDQSAESERVYLTALNSSTRSVRPAIDQTLDTIAELESLVE